ncbi:TonB-dependent receptor [Chitinophaga sp. SYP-B3965]|uniref:outer membrane beta-barrel family protein n=1 Tax=Chitinophaga sp. SYP-B3965 TaxID=2663120 RepID=UPI001299EF41|nr:outer membrane beta-barrel family protein [Chitinophaga sp. SYP-B3965]MRG48424.1 TonB-dependent receptor [Chitinophaga sp. SYP-B3965]
MITARIISLLCFCTVCTLEITAQQRTLKEVKITGKPPLVTRKADRYIINIENSVLANGYSGLDVLQKSPGLWVSPDGNIKITGNQSVTVMINDVVQRMTGLELSEYLKTLRSEDISKIEVIPNPPAEFEASSSGGIVHIILKKARRQGVTGTLSAQYKQQGKKPYAGAGVSLDYKMKKWYLFGGYNYVKDNSFYTGYTATDYPDKSYIYNSTERDNNNARQQYRAGIVYDFSPTHSVNVQHNGNSSQLLQNFSSGIIYQRPADLVTGNANTDWVRRPHFTNTTVSYAWNIDTLGSSLKVIGDYARSSKEESNTLISVYSDPDMSNGFRTITPSTTEMYSAQADYTLGLRGKSIARTGIKYAQINRHNSILAEDEATGNWIKNPARSDDFLYDERLLMFYGSFEKMIRRTSIKAGLRGEQTYSKGISLISGETIRRNYFGWFPSLFIDHTLDEQKGNSIHLNYSRRVRRPAYNDLNPYRLQVNDFAVLTGNPDLLPQFTNSIQAGYTWNREYTADLYFKSSTNYIAQTARTIEERIIEHMSKNFPGNTEFGLSLSAPFAILKNWRTNNGLLLYRATADLDEVRISRTSISLKTIHTYEWKKVADIDLYVEYNSPYTSANSRMSYVFYADLGMSRRIWKNKGRIRLSFTDLFNTFREKELTEYNNTRINFYQKRPTRTAGVSFVWNFSAGKEFAKKKIDANNSDEKTRMGN